ncbi:MAG: Gfo/Idh/MocA family protein [Thermoguttaceae bacterium]
MQPKPDQRALGQENFYAAIGSDLLRRAFLKEVNAEGVTSGNGLGAKFFGYGTVDKPVRVAVLGTGDEGSILIGAINPKYVQVAAIADIRPYNQWRAFHGDNYSEDIKKLRTGLNAKYGWKDEAEGRQNVRVYGDYRELLQRESENTDEATRIQGVIIALPLHLHAPAAIAAMEAGFHVLTEKLMGHTVAKCKDMARAAEKYKKHMATGHQRHYNVLYDHAKKLLASGVLGDLHYIRAQWHRNNQPGRDSWQMPLPPGVKDGDAQGGRLDRELESWKKQLESLEGKASADEIQSWKMKIAQKEAQIADALLIKGGEHNGASFKSATDYGYEDATLHIEGSPVAYERPALEELIRWRLFNRTSAGLMAELGSHQLDASSIFIAAMHDGKKQYPLRVSASSTRSIFPTQLDKSPLDRDADDHITCVYDYAAPGYNPDDPIGKQRKITVAYSSINGNGFGGYGEVVFGTRGTLLIETEKEAMLFRGASLDDKTVVVEKKSRSGETFLDIEPSAAGDPLSAAIGLQATFGDVSRGYTEQIEHWAYCISENPEPDYTKENGVFVSGKPMPRCYPEVALADAVIALTTNIAADRSETVDFDRAWFDYHSDATPEAHFAESDEEKKKFTPETM